MTALPTALAALPRTADYVVDGDEVQAYRRLVRSALDPSPGTGSGPLVASPLHPFIVAWSTFDRAVSILTGLDDPGVVHLSQEIEQRRPLVAGDVLRSELDILGVRHERQGTKISFLSELFDADGVEVARLTTTLVVLGVLAPEPFGQPVHHRADPATSTLLELRARIPVDFPPRYAALTADHNPIHLDPEAAVAAGMGGVVAHGMSVVAVVVEEAIRHLCAGDAGSVTGVGVRFARPVMPGEELTVTFGRTEARPDRIVYTVRTPGGLAQKGGWIDVAH